MLKHHQAPLRRLPRGFSLVGLLITMVCIVVLFSILMSSLNKVVTGEGSAVQGTVRSFQDELALYGLFQSMAVHAAEDRNRFIVPSNIAASRDISLDTTANLFSAMVMQNYTVPRQLISGNEYSGYVEEYLEYDYTRYNPAAHEYWDPNFKADLHDLSHVSYAHMPLFGKRLEKRWRSTFGNTFPLIGNRGPQDGVDNPQSRSYGRNQRWGGHAVFGDGHVQFFDTFTPAQLYIEQDGQRYSDNMFAMESGPHGEDAILSFTKSMSAAGPELQYD